MVIAAAILTVYYSVHDGGPYLAPLICAVVVSAILDAMLFRVRPFWTQEENIPNKKFYRK